MTVARMGIYQTIRNTCARLRRNKTKSIDPHVIVLNLRSRFAIGRHSPSAETPDLFPYSHQLFPVEHAGHQHCQLFQHVLLFAAAQYKSHLLTYHWVCQNRSCPNLSPVTEIITLHTHETSISPLAFFLASGRNGFICRKDLVRR